MRLVNDIQGCTNVFVHFLRHQQPFLKSCFSVDFFLYCCIAVTVKLSYSYSVGNYIIAYYITSDILVFFNLYNDREIAQRIILMNKLFLNKYSNNLC